jgi:hypothetical protein
MKANEMRYTKNIPNLKKWDWGGGAGTESIRGKKAPHPTEEVDHILI